VPSVSLGQSWPEVPRSRLSRRPVISMPAGRLWARRPSRRTVRWCFPIFRWAGTGSLVRWMARMWWCRGRRRRLLRRSPRVAAPTECGSSADPCREPEVEIVTGPKGTKVAGRLTEEPVPKGVEPHPHINQASVPGNVPQRSSTDLGQGTPVDPNEPQPKPRQQDVKKGNAAGQ
jgi:hypothetical protein